MVIIGLTGGIGSGKSTIASYFAEFTNNAVYIADVEAKKLMNTSLKIRKKLTTLFGEKAYVNNNLNRSFIAAQVFEDKESLIKLNAIVHPEVKTHFNSFVTSNKDKKYIVYENAILFESKSYLFCHKIISVFAPLEERINRVILRDNCTREDVLKRINNQWKEDKKHLLSNYLIYNTTLSSIQEKVLKIHKKLT